MSESEDQNPKPVPIPPAFWASLTLAEFEEVMDRGIGPGEIRRKYVAAMAGNPFPATEDAVKAKEG